MDQLRRSLRFDEIAQGSVQRVLHEQFREAGERRILALCTQLAEQLVAYLALGFACHRGLRCAVALEGDVAVLAGLVVQHTEAGD